MGSNENDILFGRFAERRLSRFTPEQLDRFEHLLGQTDSDLFDWVTGKRPVPDELNDDVMAMIREFVQTEASVP
ncbi:FAD assembly factor SdhE [Magnetospirillum molischianum]|nr:succinate dehydrogenase assembly factor 2 [Magnetospirillum molischianum]